MTIGVLGLYRICRSRWKEASEQIHGVLSWGREQTLFKGDEDCEPRIRRITRIRGAEIPKLKTEN